MMSLVFGKSTEEIQATVGKFFRDELPSLDEDIVEYLSSLVAGCEDLDHDCSTLKQLVCPFLESYGAAQTDDEAIALAAKLCRYLIESSVIVSVKRNVELGSQKRLEKPVNLENTVELSDWGLATLPNQNKANKTVDSISDALENKKSSVKLNKKAEKERRKELAKTQKLEQAARNRRTEEQTSAGIYMLPPCKTCNKSSSRDVFVPNIYIYVGGGNCLLEDADLKLVSKRKYGLIGRNGVGKSTLLRHISHRNIENFPADLTVLHVEQEVSGDNTSVLSAVLNADIERARLISLEKDLLKKLENNVDEKESIQLQNDLNTTSGALQAIGADSAEAKARIILNGLGFQDKDQESLTKNLSGGWRMRVALATALYLEPDILMLDEPTNHLDLEACVWLERYLQNYKNTLILVSHDRKFANNIISDVIHFEKKKLVYYKGDIDTFEHTRANQRLQQQREYESQQNKREHIQKFVDKFRYNAKRASLVQSRIKALQKMKQIDAVEDDSTFTFTFPEPFSELDKLIEVQSISFGYPPEQGDKLNLLFENIELSIHSGSRVSILGPNGCGKSTFLKLLLGKLQPVRGYVQRDPKLRVAQFTQHHVEQLEMELSPLKYLLSLHTDVKEEAVRSHLARYGIPEILADQKIWTLSGGQKSRVAFAVVTWQKPHVLILDEPTNHLDLETVEALILAISAFKGGVVFVSHDQYFIEMCAEEFWVIKNFNLIRFNGTFDEYKAWAIPKDD